MWKLGAYGINYRLVTFYVSWSTGNDNNEGSEANPFKTIQRAINSGSPGPIGVVRIFVLDYVNSIPGEDISIVSRQVVLYFNCTKAWLTSISVRNFGCIEISGSGVCELTIGGSINAADSDLKGAVEVGDGGIATFRELVRISFRDATYGLYAEHNAFIAVSTNVKNLTFIRCTKAYVMITSCASANILNSTETTTSMTHGARTAPGSGIQVTNFGTLHMSKLDFTCNALTNGVYVAQGGIFSYTSITDDFKTASVKIRATNGGRFYTGSQTSVT